MREFRRRFFPEQGNRQPSRGMGRRGGDWFGISVPPRTDGVITPEIPTTSPTQPRPDTTEPILEQEQEKPKKHTGRNLAVAGGSLFVAGLGAYGAYETVPIESFANSFNDTRLVIADFFTAPSLEERFPNQMPQSAFIPVSSEEKRELWKNTKSVDFDKHTITIGFFTDQNTLQKSSIRQNQEFNAILPPYIDKEQLKQDGVLNLRHFTGFPKGAPIYFQYDTDKFEASAISSDVAGETKSGGGMTFTPAYTTIRIILRDRVTGETFGFIIGGLHAKQLIEIPPFPEDHGPVYEDGAKIDPNKPILRLDTDLQDFDGKGQILPGQKGQVYIKSFFDQPNPRAPIPLTVNFLQIPEGNIAVNK